MIATVPRRGPQHRVVFACWGGKSGTGPPETPPPVSNIVMRFISYVCVVTAFALLRTSVLCAQTSPQFVSKSEITDKSLNSLLKDPRIRAFDLSPDGSLIASLVEEGAREKAPLWLVVFATDTNHIVASRELGPSAPSSTGGDFRKQVLYSSDQLYLVVQDLQQIKVLDVHSLETLRTIPVPAGRQIPLFVAGAGKSDILVCAFGAEHQPYYGLRATPVQVEVVDVSSGEILGTWASEDVPQAVSPNGDLIAVSWWQTPGSRRPVPLAVFDRNGRKVADLHDGFSFNTGDYKSRPQGRVLGRFISTQNIVIMPDEHLDDLGRRSGNSIKLIDITGRQARQSVRPRHFALHGEMAISGDGRTIVIKNFYTPPGAVVYDVLPGEEGKLLVLGRAPKLHLDSAVPVDIYAEEPRVSADGLVIAIMLYHPEPVSVPVLFPDFVNVRHASDDGALTVFKIFQRKGEHLAKRKKGQAH